MNKGIASAFLILEGRGWMDVGNVGKRASGVLSELQLGIDSAEHVGVSVGIVLRSGSGRW